MPQYVILQHHEPNICPMTNKAVREFALKSFPKLEGLGKQKGVKVIQNIHLDPDHRALVILDAPSAEAARDFMVLGGFSHFTRMEFFLATPVEELIKKANEFPAIY